MCTTPNVHLKMPFNQPSIGNQSQKADGLEWCNLNLQFCIAQNIGHRGFSFGHWSLAWITPSVTRRSNTFLKVNNHPKHYLEACECIKKCMLSSHLHLVLLTSILRASLASASSKPPFDNDASFNLNLLISLQSIIYNTIDHPTMLYWSHTSSFARSCAKTDGSNLRHI